MTTTFQGSQPIARAGTTSLLVKGQSSSYSRESATTMTVLGQVALSLLLFVPTTVVVADPTFTDVHGGNDDAPRVGLYGLQACTVSTADDACMQNTDMVQALDADQYLFGMY